jgi:hypothetical protein
LYLLSVLPVSFSQAPSSYVGSVSKSIRKWNALLGHPLQLPPPLPPASTPDNNAELTPEQAQLFAQLGKQEEYLLNCLGIPVLLPPPISIIAAPLTSHCPHLTPLALYIYEIDSFLHHLSLSVKDYTKKQEALTASQLTKSTKNALLDIQRQLFHPSDPSFSAELGLSNSRIVPKTTKALSQTDELPSPSKEMTGTRTVRFDPTLTTTHLIGLQDQKQHEDRLQACKEYYDYLTKRAQKKKPVLRKLQTLWMSTLIQIQHTTQGHMAEKTREMLRSLTNKKMSSHDDLRMSKEEIVQQTKHMQQMILEDIHTPPTVMQQQVQYNTLMLYKLF